MTPSPVIRALVVLLGLGSALALLTLAALDPAGSTWALVWVPYAVMAAWVLWRQPTNRIGWFMLAIAVLFTTITLINWSVTGDRGPDPVALELASPVLAGVAWLTFLLMVLLFPDGIVTSRSQAWLVRTGWVLMAIGALLAVASPSPLPDSGRLGPFAGTPLGDLSHAVAPVMGIMLALLPLAVVVNLIQRWRASGGVRREQFKWFFWGAVITIAVLVIGSTASDSIGPEALAYTIWVIGGAALPVSIAIAVMRYRLYDIDRVISRTTSYAIVTGLLLTVYAAIVTSASRLLHTDSPLVVATATLAAAALARPALRRVQTLVDRRFDQTRYDSLQTLDAFGRGLRNEVDVARIEEQLLTAVRATLAPEGASLWTKEHA
jgi:hypothetical protein